MRIHTILIICLLAAPVLAVDQNSTDYKAGLYEGMKEGLEMGYLTGQAAAGAGTTDYGSAVAAWNARIESLFAGNETMIADLTLKTMSDQYSGMSPQPDVVALNKPVHKMDASVWGNTVQEMPSI